MDYIYVGKIILVLVLKEKWKFSWNRFNRFDKGKEIFENGK